MRVRFRVPTARTDIESEGQVVWAEQGVGMGIQFSMLDRDSRAAIESFVHASFFSNRKA